jgi:DNA-directed RNA polymerase specialized sigma24 family protein
VASAEEFVEFAEVMFPRLRRTAFLLCGDWHTAEDLAQTALAKMFVAWGCPGPSGLWILVGSSPERTGSSGREIPEVHS